MTRLVLSANRMGNYPLMAIPNCDYGNGFSICKEINPKIAERDPQEELVKQKQKTGKARSEGGEIPYSLARSSTRFGSCQFTDT